MDMKKLLPIIIVALVATACDIYVVEPRYDKRDSILGRYSVEEYSETYNDYTSYTFWIEKSYAYDEIRISNFYAADISVIAYVDYDKITIPLQVVNGFEIEGTGTIYASKLHLSYSVRDKYQNAPTDFCQTDAWFE